MANQKILIVDDDTNICELLRLYLEKDGFDTEVATDGLKALDAFKTTNPALVLLDIMLPKMDGLSVCRTVRGFSNVPIIMLSAKSEDIDKILGLEYGADDYVTKPFNIREVTSRIKAILRRVTPREKAAESNDMLVSGDITLDYNFRRVIISGKIIELTSKEFDLLELFVKNPGKVYTRENLLDIAWGFDYPGDARTVDVHIRRLREKIEPNPAEPDYIKTKWGVGYYYKKD